MTPAELIQARQELGLSQKDLAEALGVHVTILNRWENGKTKIPPHLRLALDGLALRRLLAALDRAPTIPQP